MDRNSVYFRETGIQEKLSSLLSHWRAETEAPRLWRRAADWRDVAIGEKLRRLEPPRAHGATRL